VSGIVGLSIVSGITKDGVGTNAATSICGVAVTRAGGSAAAPRRNDRGGGGAKAITVVGGAFGVEGSGTETSEPTTISASATT
jgi:hypothetical protein